MSSGSECASQYCLQHFPTANSGKTEDFCSEPSLIEVDYDKRCSCLTPYFALLEAPLAFSIIYELTMNDLKAIHLNQSNIVLDIF